MTEAKKDLEIREYPLPKVEPGCMLVKITCCTICGSDLHTIAGRRQEPAPLILGHENAGWVENPSKRIALCMEGRKSGGYRSVISVSGPTS